ncbi:unnamed protein product [Ostreobium quekettii]|uniref:Uncharacterized protein n=1 Tax=Ostreobium quekettii TaxID=121088 RepID=A0A8S1INJ7_9CHLO|nr:unnamed protein product [Ostreobium quekettii]|eukprot:evm.model.scf_535.9 EVM.evm.TU.scf_535.9   scf_535:62147-63253(-)
MDGLRGWDVLPQDFLRAVLVATMASHTRPEQRAVLVRSLRLVNRAWCRETSRLPSCLKVSSGPLRRIRLAMRERFAGVRTLMLLAGVQYQFSELPSLLSFPSLEVLDLSLLPERLGGYHVVASLPLKMRLHLSQFQLQSEWDALKPLGGMTSLRCLGLARCELSDHLTLFRDLTGLTSMRLIACTTPDAGVACLWRMPWLRELWMDLCIDVTDGGLAGLSNLVGLTKLKIGRMQRVEDAGIRGISELVSLSELSLRDLGKIDNDQCIRGLTSLTGLTRLELRDLGYKWVGGTRGDYLTAFSGLLELDISGSALVDDVALELLTDLTSLRVLTARYMPSNVSASTWQLLLDALPGLELHKDEEMDLEAG